MDFVCLNVLLFLSMILRIYSSGIKGSGNVNPTNTVTGSLECQTHSDKSISSKNDDNVYYYNFDEYLRQLDDFKESLEMHEYKSVFKSCYFDNTDVTFESFIEPTVIEIIVELICFLQTVLEEVKASKELTVIYKKSTNYLKILYTSVLLNSKDILKKSLLINMRIFVFIVLHHLFKNGEEGQHLLFCITKYYILNMEIQYKCYKILLNKIASAVSEKFTNSEFKSEDIVDQSYFTRQYDIMYKSYIEHNSVENQKLFFRVLIDPEYKMSHFEKNQLNEPLTKKD